MAARKHEGGGTDGGVGGHQPLGVPYTATQILTLFNHTTSYSFKLPIIDLYVFTS
jgi:hypothetical protein